MANIGEAVIKLSLDGSSIKGELANTEKNVESLGGRVGKVARNISKVMVAGFAAATTAAVAFSKSSINAFNEAEKAGAKLAQSAKNQNWYEGAVDDLKAYNSELQKLGIIEDDAYAAGQAQLGTFALSAEAVKELTPAMGDLIAATSGYGATADDATQMANLMGKVMTGNVGALTRYGVTLDENQKKLLQEGDEMVRAATLAEVLRQNYGGFNEALAKTPQGQVKQLANNFGDLREEFGAFLAGRGDLSGFFDTLTTVINQAIDLVVTMAPTITEGIVKLVSEIGKQLPSIMQQLLPVIANALTQLLVAWYEFQPMVIDMITNSVPILVDAVIQLMNALVNAIPTIIPQLITAITNLVTTIATQLTRPDFLSSILKAGLTLMMSLVNAIPQMLVALVNALPQIINNILSFLLDPANLQMIIEAAVQLFLGLVMAVPQILGALLGAFGNLVGNLWNGITSMFGTFAANFGSFIGDIFKGAINGVLTFIENFINAPIDLLNGFIGLINDAFGWIGVNIGKVPRINLPRLATGGVVESSTIAMIGEEGQEAVLPLENNTDNWAGTLAGILTEKMNEEDEGEGAGRTINVYMTNEINNKLDAAEMGRTMVQSIRRFA